MKRFLRENWFCITIAIPSIATIVWILYPDSHDSTRISAAAGVAVAAATLILAALTWRSVKISREHIEIQRRPILIPDSPLMFLNSESSMANVWERLNNADAVRIRLRNAGGGTALNVRAVLILRPYNPKVLPTQFSAFEAFPLPSGDSREIEMGLGGTIFNIDDQAGGVQLGVPPEEPGPENVNPANRRPRRVARLTLTWRDEAGLKHAGFFDLDAQSRWHVVGFRHGIPRDLQDLDEEKGVQIRKEQRGRLNPFRQ
ncbi:hypothetical protein [Thermoflexus sp.]|uniref:hypothetical protein n=1 Tax=Thermoflexus sp. TaxID=1969742 RepID=UPI002ADDD043|nr:hypothetical protein [Thermoflexus sp.]